MGTGTAPLPGGGVPRGRRPEQALTVSHPRLRSEVVDLQSKSVVPRATSTHQYTARGSQIAALKGRVSSSLAVCLGAKTDEVPTSTFWTLSGILVSGA